MVIRAVLFDIYGTLVDISTDEGDWYTYLNLAKYFEYRGLKLNADEVRWFYFEKIRKILETSSETYPEIDVRQIWREILTEHENPELYKLRLDHGTFLRDIVVLHRALTRRRLRLFDATYDTLQRIKESYRIGIVSDCQHDYAVPETKILGILDFFDAFIMSGEYGFRKPDKRLFQECLSKLGVRPDEAVFAGDDVFRDIQGAKSAGLRTVLVLNGHGPQDTSIAKPDFIADDIGQVPEIVKTLD